MNESDTFYDIIDVSTIILVSLDLMIHYWNIAII